MGIFLTAIKWLFTAVFALLLLLILLLCVKAGVYCEFVYTKKDGFKWSGKITYGMIVKKIGKKTKKQEKAQKGAENTGLKSGKEKNKQDKKTPGEVIDTVKAVCRVVCELKSVPEKVLEFKKECVWCKVALDDPMNCGIAYSAVSGALIAAVTTVYTCFKTDEYKVRVTPDFVAHDGISIKNITWVRLRPVYLIFCLIRAYIKNKDLRDAVRDLRALKKKKGAVKRHEQRQYQ